MEIEKMEKMYMREYKEECGKRKKKQNKTKQHNTTQHNTTQHNTTQHTLPLVPTYEQLQFLRAEHPHPIYGNHLPKSG
jgi:hypothetical protein